jgi:hypothetical protein
MNFFSLSVYGICLSITCYLSGKCIVDLLAIEQFACGIHYVLCKHSTFFVTGLFELAHCVWVIIINVCYSVYLQYIFVCLFIYFI